MNDNNLDEQIDKIISDLKVKITKLVQKTTTKLLKEQSRSFKDELKTKNSGKNTQVRSKKSKGYDTDDDSD